MKKIIFVLVLVATACMVIPQSSMAVQPSVREVKGGKILFGGDIGYNQVSHKVFPDGHEIIRCKGRGVNLCPDLPDAEEVPGIIIELIKDGESEGEFTHNELNVVWYDGVINEDGIAEFTFETTLIEE